MPAANIERRDLLIRKILYAPIIQVVERFVVILEFRSHAVLEPACYQRVADNI